MWHLHDLESRLVRWVAWAETRLAVKPDTAVLAGELSRHQHDEIATITHDDPEEISAAYELATPSRMNVDGLARYLKRRRP